jgi:hypothetical protein
MTLGELWKYCLPTVTSFFYCEVPFDLFDCAVVHQLDQSFWNSESHREHYQLGKIFSSLGCYITNPIHAFSHNGYKYLIE